jgi:predicted phage baseplate assembly protein
MPFPREDWETVPLTGEEVIAASEALLQSARLALPAVLELTDAGGQNWSPRRDLLSSDAFDTVFVLEVENGGKASLRFGDGIYGMTPEAGVAMTVTYRIGNGVAGNVGADSLYHFVTTPGLGIVSVTNPLAAVGGTDPESLAEVRLYAPQAFRTQERAVTEEDYAEVAQRHEDVDRAIAQRRWTGSWHTMFVTVDRKEGRTVDAAFEDRLSEHVDRYKLALPCASA